MKYIKVFENFDNDSDKNMHDDNEVTFVSYTKGVPAFFKYTPKRGIRWRRDILAAIQKALAEIGVKVTNRNQIRAEGIDLTWEGFDWNTLTFPKFIYNEELKKFERV